MAGYCLDFAVESLVGGVHAGAGTVFGRDTLVDHRADNSSQSYAHTDYCYSSDDDELPELVHYSSDDDELPELVAVSYTHLTLPTIYSV